MATAQSGKPTPEELANYVKLAEIVQTGFDARRLAEWKIKLSFWAAFGLTFYAVDQRFEVIKNIKLYFVGAVIAVFIIYFFFELAFQRGNVTDKKWKHYYMGRAEGIEGDDNLRPPKGLASYCEGIATIWFWSYILFTLVLALALIAFVYLRS